MCYNQRMKTEWSPPVDVVHELEQRAEAGNYVDVLDYVCAWIEGGRTLVELTASVQRKVKSQLGEMTITATLRHLFGKATVAERYAQARADSAVALADHAVEIIDEASTASREELKKAVARSEVRQWLASKYNRAVFGDAPPSVAVQVNIPSLHLDALRQRESAAVSAPRVSANPSVSVRVSPLALLESGRDDEPSNHSPDILTDASA